MMVKIDLIKIHLKIFSLETKTLMNIPHLLLYYNQSRLDLLYKMKQFLVLILHLYFFSLLVFLCQKELHQR